LAFDIPLKSQALLTVVYPGQAPFANGAALSASDVANLPLFYLDTSTATAGNFSTTDTFTLFLADAAAIGDPDAQGDYRHFLANGVTPTQGTSATNLTINPVTATIITDYAGPGPAAGEGAHRYLWALFQQPSSFQAPSNLSTANTPPDHWDVNSYVPSTGLGSLVAGAFFTVENGQASFTAQSTSSINTATVAGAITAASGAAPASGSLSASHVSAQATTTASTGDAASAVGRGAALVFGSITALVAAFV